MILSGKEIESRIGNDIAITYLSLSHMTYLKKVYYRTQ